MTGDLTVLVCWFAPKAS